MDKAKQAVNSFMTKAGHHDTTVHESVAPSVQKETVNEQKREEKQVVRDREVHQDHFHTSVQPVKDREILPEQHHHNLAGVEHRTHDHRNHSETKERLQNEGAQFRNESVRAPAHHTTSTAVPEVAGEHVHHHVHETIQPVVHKETIEPHVVHTTVPVHETHYNTAQHHTASALPAVSMTDFKKQGGSLTGRDERHDHFVGEPRSIEQTAGNAMAHTGAGQHSSMTNDGVTGSGHHNGATGGLAGAGTGPGNHHTGGQTTDSAHHAATGTHGTKPSLMDKLNPMKDADGDGKKGFMK